MGGDDVLQWQRQMIHRGWNLEADGVFKERDENVLKQFQKQKGLTVDGIIGPIRGMRHGKHPSQPTK